MDNLEYLAATVSPAVEPHCFSIGEVRPSDRMEQQGSDVCKTIDDYFSLLTTRLPKQHVLP